MRPKEILALAILTLAGSALAQQTPTPAAARWWHETAALANDSMEGRDTGTEAYERAARYVAAKFAAAGLKPAGDNSTFFQRVPMHQTDLDLARSSIEITGPAGHLTPLRLIHEITLTPRPRQRSDIDAAMVFLGYGLPPDIPADLNGRIAVIFNNTPAGLTPGDRASLAARRVKALTEAGVSAILSIDNPAATEPFHWPAAYARSVTLASAAPDTPADTPLLLRISATAAPELFRADPAHPFAALLQSGEAGAPLPAFPLHSGLRLRLHTTEKDISSPNILATLPGSDPSLAPEYVALSAHLDGYGYGTPILGEGLYNGALDDAAYVATLLGLAEEAIPRHPRRSLLFLIFTGEEKGLLGSAYFTQHPTVSAAQIVADLNLDQLRPIFPLKILTMEGITDSTLGDTARSIAQKYGIELRPDMEPERNLFRRADNYNFVRIGVPIGSFIFGYNRGTPEEAIYRDWYARRYHKPQDDLSTPIDWGAAVTFNNFFRDLTLAIADTPDRPSWSPTSPYRPTTNRGNKTTARLCGPYTSKNLRFCTEQTSC